MIQFKNIPGNLRLPLFFAELNNSNANSGQNTLRALLIGQVLAAGTAVANVPQICQGVADAKTVGGSGSILADTAAGYLANDTFGEVWYGPVSDAGGTAATGTVLFAGTATGAGALSLYIGGQLVSVAVTVGMTAAQLATAVVAQITAQPDLLVSAIVDGVTAAQVDLTAKNRGLTGNSIDVRTNYRGAAAGEALPAGITATITAMAAGATNPSLTTLLANLGDMQFDFIVCPFTDPASMAAITAFLNDTTGRWSWQSQLYGGAYYANSAIYSSQVTLGTGMNDQHSSVMGFSGSPTPPWRWAAAIAAQRAISARADPSVPMQTVILQGVLAPPTTSLFTASERNTLLYDGISTFTVDQAGNVAIENLITTYQVNSFDQPDDSYLQVETLDTLAAVLRDMKSVVTSKYARVKIGNPGQRYDASAGVVTLTSIKADFIARYQYLETVKAWVVDSAGFAAGLQVQQNPTNPSRIDVYWPGDIIDGLRQLAVSAAFKVGLSAAA